MAEHGVRITGLGPSHHIVELGWFRDVLGSCQEIIGVPAVLHKMTISTTEKIWCKAVPRYHEWKRCQNGINLILKVCTIPSCWVKASSGYYQYYSSEHNYNTQPPRGHRLNNCFCILQPSTVNTHAQTLRYVATYCHQTFKYNDRYSFPSSIKHLLNFGTSFQKKSQCPSPWALSSWAWFAHVLAVHWK